MLGEVMAVAMFFVAIGVLLMGFPVAFSLAGTAILFAGMGLIVGEFNPRILNALPSRYLGTMLNEVLVAVPLFIFMGVMLERSRIAEELLQTMGEAFGRMRGGLGIAVIFVGALLAASTGIVGATVVTMGLMSLPAMLRAGYNPRLATGAICASGTLGQVIPPSIVLVLLASVMAGPWEQAQRAVGNFAPQPFTVVDLFAGAFIPGLILVVLYMGWVALVAFLRPSEAPMIHKDPAEMRGMMTRIVRVMIPPILLIIAVLGSILAGIATPTEAASVGAVGATLLAIANRQFTWTVLVGVTRQTVQISTMVFVIILGASVFALVFRGLGGDDLVIDILQNLPGGLFTAMFLVMAVMFILGFFIDFIEIVYVVIPLVGPAMLMFDGISPVWFGVMVAINLQTSFLTPPFGFALFYLRGVAPPSVRTIDIYSGIIPFVLIQLSMLFILAAFPELADWLPRVLFGTSYS